MVFVCWRASPLYGLDVPYYFQGAFVLSYLPCPSSSRSPPLPPLVLTKPADVGDEWSRAFLSLNQCSNALM